VFIPFNDELLYVEELDDLLTLSFVIVYVTRTATRMAAKQRKRAAIN
jgi:hypothetical protein